MIILNMGIPRSGTVWAFNVFREFWTREQLDFRTASPNRPQEVDEAVQGLRPTEEHVILHFHDVTPAVVQLASQPDVRSFFNFRDPRDVVVSQMNLHDIGFEDAVQMTITGFQSLKTVARFPGLMLIPYVDITEHAEPLIFQMGTRLGLLPRRSTVQEIARATSAERHRSLMPKAPPDAPALPETTTSSSLDVSSSQEKTSLTEDGIAPHLAAEPAVETVRSGWRDIRMDRTHLLTDRHIQSGRSGRWRTELSQPQQQAVCERFAPVIDLFGMPD